MFRRELWGLHTVANRGVECSFNGGVTRCKLKSHVRNSSIAAEGGKRPFLDDSEHTWSIFEGLLTVEQCYCSCQFCKFTCSIAAEGWKMTFSDIWNLYKELLTIAQCCCCHFCKFTFTFIVARGNRPSRSVSAILFSLHTSMWVINWIKTPACKYQISLRLL